MKQIALLVLTAVLAGSAQAQISYAERVVELVNEERAALGLPPLKATASLDTAALQHSQAMADRDFFAHCDVDTGSLPWNRMSATGYAWQTAGENIAAGQGSPESVMNAWMNSDGHRANILSANYAEIGVGYVFEANDNQPIRFDQNGDCVADAIGSSGYGRYWTQNFGRREGVYPMVLNGEAAQTESISVVLFTYGSGFASEMRIRNENQPWSPWQPFTPQRWWRLAPQLGWQVVEIELRSAGGQTRSAVDTIELTTLADAADALFVGDFNDSRHRQ